MVSASMRVATSPVTRVVHVPEPRFAIRTISVCQRYPVRVCVLLTGSVVRTDSASRVPVMRLVRRRPTAGLTKSAKLAFAKPISPPSFSAVVPTLAEKPKGASMESASNHAAIALAVVRDLRASSAFVSRRFSALPPRIVPLVPFVWTAVAANRRLHGRKQSKKPALSGLLFLFCKSFDIRGLQAIVSAGTYSLCQNVTA